MSSPDWMNTLKVTVPPKPPGSGARLRGLGIVIGIAIAAAAVFALTHTLRNVDYNEVFEVVRRTNTGLIALAAVLVATSYGSLTLYDLLALRTIVTLRFRIGSRLLRVSPAIRLRTVLARFR
jgi:hypothetical protein